MHPSRGIGPGYKPWEAHTICPDKHVSHLQMSDHDETSTWDREKACTLCGIYSFKNRITNTSFHPDSPQQPQRPLCHPRRHAFHTRVQRKLAPPNLISSFKDAILREENILWVQMPESLYEILNANPGRLMIVRNCLVPVDKCYALDYELTPT